MTETYLEVMNRDELSENDSQVSFWNRMEDKYHYLGWLELPIEAYPKQRKTVVSHIMMKT